MISAALVHADEVPAEQHAPGASTRNLLATGPAGPQLARRLVDIRPGSDFDGTAGPGGELWFVIAGAGRLDLADQPGLPDQPGRPDQPGLADQPGRPDQPGLPVTADRALWIPPGGRYQLRAEGQADLHIDAVTLPGAEAAPTVGAGSGIGPALACDLADCAVETTGDRRFRVLFGPGRGCEAATQFVGEIPAGRAPEHSHPYDELVLILSGTGVLHTGGEDHPIQAGSCAHLPPGQLHCLENTGRAILRVLGVFHPADSPAAKNSPAENSTAETSTAETSTAETSTA